MIRATPSPGASPPPLRNLSFVTFQGSKETYHHIFIIVAIVFLRVTTHVTIAYLRLRDERFPTMATISMHTCTHLRRHCVTRTVTVLEAAPTVTANQCVCCQLLLKFMIIQPDSIHKFALEKYPASFEHSSKSFISDHITDDAFARFRWLRAPEDIKFKLGRSLSINCSAPSTTATHRDLSMRYATLCAI